MDYMDVDWSKAACIGTDWRFFYSDKDAGFTIGESRGINILLRRICGKCDIVNDCTAYAIEHEVAGFWAGMAADDRREVRNGRKARPSAA